MRRLLADQFPHWAELPVAPVATPGWDNMTFRLGDDLSVRMPRHPRWVGQVAREQRWLPRLAPRLPLAIPEPVAQGEPGAGYPFPWSVLRWLPGEPALPAQVADPARAAARLADFLAALQRIDAADGPPPEWSNGFRGCALDDERDSPVVEQRVRDKIAALEGLVDTDAATAVYESARAAPAWDRPPVWVHGDPAPSNLLTDAGELSAVIDFGTLAAGDPACDLIAAWGFVEGEARDRFRAALGVDDATWSRGRAWGLIAVLPSPEDFASAHDLRRRLAELIADHRHG